jgi:hypothetical protein
MRSDTMPATMRPAALPTASTATSTNPSSTPESWAAAIFAMWPMIMSPANAEHAYISHSSTNWRVRTISRQS